MSGPEARWSRIFLVLLLTFSVVAATTVAVVAITGNTERSKKTVDTLGQIQAERAHNIRISCRDINERHDNTLKQFDVLLAKARETATPKEIEELEQNRDGTILLLEAIVPKRDCEALIRESVDVKGTPE